MRRRRPRTTLFPYTTLFRSQTLDDAALRRNLRDIRLINRLLGWTAFTVREVARHVRSRGMERRSEEHTSELQSHSDLVCRLLLEKKKPAHAPRRQTQHPNGT